MDFMADLINKGVNTFFSNLANELLGYAFDILTDFLMNFSDVNKYIDIKQFLVYSQAIACAFLSSAIVWQVFKAQSGGAFKGEKSVSVLAMKTVFSGAFIYFLPHFVMKILIPINNLVINVISEVGKAYQVEPDKIFNPIKELIDQKNAFVLGVLVLAIALLILAIMSAIRYIDLMICILIAPFAAISIVGDGEGLSTWARETCAIVFTQSIHILLLQILMKLMVETKGITMLILGIGTVVVMIKGSSVLKTYTHKTGVGSGVLSLGSMAIMQTNMIAMKGLGGA